MTHYPHIAARLFNTPLLLHPGKLDAIIAGLGQRILGADILNAAAAAPEMFSTRSGPRAERGYQVIDGVARINIGGALVHRSRMDADSTYLLGYNDIAADIEDAAGNPDAHAIVLVFDSPGGEVSGAFELAERLHALRGIKPITAVVDAMAASAAYLAASAADEIVTTTTGYSGSIGVVARHVDFSRALDNDGIKITHIFAGAHKVDGNPFEPLPESVRADFQADINDLYEQFVATVAAHRSLPPEAVRKTQAQTYRGPAAIAARLADRIGTTDQVLAELAAQRPTAIPAGRPAPHQASQPGVTTMADTTTGAPTTAQTPASAPPGADASAAAAANAAAAAMQAERERTAAILALPTAAQHTALAHQCIALGLSVEQSSAILAAAPAATTAAANPFAQHMAALGNPKVTGTEAPDAEAAAPAVVAASWDSAFGIHPGRA